MSRGLAAITLLLAGCVGWGADPFADEVVQFTPGELAGFGQDQLPDIVLGAPVGAGDRAGSQDVLSLGEGGSIVLGFLDLPATDGSGVDLLVFENAFTGWSETGAVEASEDGVTWHAWPCDPADSEAAFPGCAGVGSVYASPDNDLDPTDPVQAGGDGFDLADVGLAEAWYVRITDTGTNHYDGETGGFDLDAVAAVN